MRETILPFTLRCGASGRTKVGVTSVSHNAGSSLDCDKPSDLVDLSGLKKCFEGNKEIEVVLKWRWSVSLRPRLSLGGWYPQPYGILTKIILDF